MIEVKKLHPCKMDNNFTEQTQSEGCHETDLETGDE